MKKTCKEGKGNKEEKEDGKKERRKEESKKNWENGKEK